MSNVSRIKRMRVCRWGQFVCVICQPLSVQEVHLSPHYSTRDLCANKDQEGRRRSVGFACEWLFFAVWHHHHFCIIWTCPFAWCFVVSCGFLRRHQNSGTCRQNVRPCQFGKRKDKTKNSTTGGNLAREDRAVGIVSSEIGFTFFFFLWGWICSS